MKILGKNSLSSKVLVGLYGLFALITLIDIGVFAIIFKTVRDILNNTGIEAWFDFILFTIVIFTGLMALFIIIQFMKIFQNLKNNVLFCKENIKSLSNVSYSCLFMAVLYFIISILIFCMLQKLTQGFVFYIPTFSITFTILFFVFGIGIKILNEIYKKAIEYKEENDYTI